MNWRQWECFLEVGKCLNYSQASTNLFLNQSVVSYHIQNLESSMGIKLFRRTSHSVEFTPTGKELYNRCAPVFDELISIVNSFDKNAQPHNIYLSSTYMINYKIFTPIFDEIKVIHPNLNIITKQLERSNVLEQLIDGNIDLAFAFEEEAMELDGLSFLPLFTIRRNGILVNKSNPLAQKSSIRYSDLRNQTVILTRDIEASPRLTYFYQQILKRKNQFNIIYADDMLSAYVAVAEGKGICAAMDFMPTSTDNIALLYNSDDPLSTSGICISKTNDSIYTRELVQFLCEKYPIE